MGGGGGREGIVGDYGLNDTSTIFLSVTEYACIDMISSSTSPFLTISFALFFSAYTNRMKPRIPFKIVLVFHLSFFLSLFWIFLDGSHKLLLPLVMFSTILLVTYIICLLVFFQLLIHKLVLLLYPQSIIE